VNAGQKTMNSHFIGHPTADQLAAFDLGQLPAAEWREVERHIAACKECCQKLESLPEDALVRLVRESASKAAETMDQFTGSTGTSGNAAPAQVPPELVDHPRYRILEVLGSGGMGVVFKAEHRLMERTVALKVIAHQLVDNAAAVERFRQEVKAAARLTHPNIVTAYDAEQAGDVHFLVMAYVEGASLDRVLHQRGPLPVAEACLLVQQAAQGLQHAHEKGMVHRDIKPGNLLVRSADRSGPIEADAHRQAALVKIADFGLSRFASEAVAVETLTASGALVGTPDYIAPEQAMNPRLADIRADIYSLGCTLYHMLAGRPPFSSASVLQKLICHRESPVPPLAESRPDAPAELIRVVERMLAKSPVDRYQTPAAVAQALAPLTGPADFATQAAPRRDSRERVLKGVGVIAGAALVAAVAIFLLWNARGPVAQVPTDATRPSPSSTEPAVPPTPPTIEELRKQARVQAIAWLRANNVFKPSAAFVPERIKQINEPAEDGLIMALGPALVKSHRPTYLAVRGGQFFVSELTDRQARFVSHKGTNYVWVQYINYDKALRPQPPPVHLSDLKIENADMLPADRPFSATVRYRGVSQVPGSVAVRTTFFVGLAKVNAYRYLSHDLAPGPATLSFAGGPMVNGADSASGAQLVFVELCAIADRSQPDHATVISNAVAALVIAVRPGDDKK